MAIRFEAGTNKLLGLLAGLMDIAVSAAESARYRRVEKTIRQLEDKLAQLESLRGQRAGVTAEFEAIVAEYHRQLRRLHGAREPILPGVSVDPRGAIFFDLTDSLPRTERAFDFLAWLELRVDRLFRQVTHRLNQLLRQSAGFKRSFDYITTHRVFYLLHGAHPPDFVASATFSFSA